MKAEKIKRELFWEPKVGFEEGIKQTVEWYLNHLDWVSKKEKEFREYWQIVYQT
jgi:dTDP-glucose 4,6-dehydratase